MTDDYYYQTGDKNYSRDQTLMVIKVTVSESKYTDYQTDRYKCNFKKRIVEKGHSVISQRNNNKWH